MSKNFKKTKYAQLLTAAKTLKTEPADLVEKIGYNRTVVSHWARSGLMPFVAGLACEGLLRRSRRHEAADGFKIRTADPFKLIPIRILFKLTDKNQVEIIGGDGHVAEVVPGIYLITARSERVMP